MTVKPVGCAQQFHNGANILISYVSPTHTITYSYVA